jgi:hypothetical protein
MSKDDMISQDRCFLAENLCPFCSCLQIETCFASSSASQLRATGNQSSSSKALPLREWLVVRIENLDPNCPLCQLMLRAAPAALTEPRPKNVPTEKYAGASLFLETSDVVTVRLAQLQALTDISIQDLRTEAADSIFIIEIRRSRQESIGNQEQGGVYL